MRVATIPLWGGLFWGRGPLVFRVQNPQPPGVWKQRFQTPEANDPGAEPPELEDFVTFLQKKKNLDLFGKNSRFQNEVT